MKPTITHIAKRAGVSLATVSHVLNGNSRKYRINPETADKVNAIAKELKYVKPGMRSWARINEWDKSYLEDFMVWLIDSSYRIVDNNPDLFDKDKQVWVTKKVVVESYLTMMKNKK